MARFQISRILDFGPIRLGLSSHAYRKGGGKYIVSRFKLAACLHGNCSLAFYFIFFSTLFLWYPNLIIRSVVINDDLEFCVREMLRQGGSYRFLVVFILKQVQY